MKYFGWFWVDSVLTFAIAIYLIFVGYDLLKQSTKVLLLFTPSEIKISDIEKYILKDARIKNIHHIHFWQLNEEEVHLEAHICFRENVSLAEFDAYLDELEESLHTKFHINHINIQPEVGRCKSPKLIIQD